MLARRREGPQHTPPQEGDNGANQELISSVHFDFWTCVCMYVKVSSALIFCLQNQNLSNWKRKKEKTSMYLCKDVYIASINLSFSRTSTRMNQMLSCESD